MKTENLIEKLIYEIRFYKSKNHFQENIVITISVNNIEKIVNYYNKQFGFNVTVYGEIKFLGNKIISSEMLKDNEFIIGQISNI
jgi:hypothetical protein